ncbi:MAG: hypothetical protein AAGJ31_04100, partial [Verrucomicrobiota bacterium]
MDESRLDLLHSSVLSTPWIVILSIVAMTSWLGIQRIRSHFPALRQFPLLVPIGLASFALASAWLWLLLQLLGRLLVLETPWTIPTIACLGGAVFEGIIALSASERTRLHPSRRRFLLTLRLLAVGTILLILAQPVLSRLRARDIAREVVILVDDSQSMHLTDTSLDAEEQLRIARLFDLPLLDQLPDLQPFLQELRRISSDLTFPIESIQRLDPSDPEAASLVLGLAPSLPGALPATSSTIFELAAQLDAAVSDAPPSLRSPLLNLSTQLEDKLLRRLAATTASLAESPPRVADLQSESRAALEELRFAIQDLSSLIQSTEDAFLAQLSPEDRDRLDKGTRRPRSEIAHRILHRLDPTSGKSALETLDERYNIRFLRFGAQSAPFSQDAWADQTSLPSSDLPDFHQKTDLARALEEVATQIPPESLAGILLLSDGRHNAELPVDDIARQLGSQGSPLCAVPIGSRYGPRDASILSLNAPQSIYLGDRIGITSEIKIDGYQGETVKAQLWAGESLLEEREIPVPERDYRATIRFAPTPTDQGIGTYRLVLPELKDERFADNNAWEFKTAVSDDRTNVLLVDSFPRWEFRYLRNLFYGRDKSVHLQYVLLQPDTIEGAMERPRIFASANRPFGEAEATHLP